MSPHAPALRAKPPAQRDPRTVLILEDDVMVGQVALAHVRAAGAEAELVHTPEEFFARHDYWRPSVVIVDLMLGDQDGLDVVQWLADSKSSSQVILASGAGQRVLDAAARIADRTELTILGSLAKPYHRHEVAALLELAGADTHASRGTQAQADLGWTEARLGEEIDAALDKGSLSIALQPKLACVGNTVVGYEVLARWLHEEVGPIMPGAFIPFVERTGRVPALTSHVLRLGLTWFAAHGGPDAQLAVNISAAELVDDNLVERARRACREADVPPSRVILELTETAAMKDTELSLEALTHLRLAGFHLSLDDFGMGYSSMEQLAQSPFSEVKIDRTFVKDLTRSREAHIMVNSIIELGHALELRCIAEGVEDAETFAELGRLGCDAAQGFHLGYPMTAAALERWRPPGVRADIAAHKRDEVGEL